MHAKKKKRLSAHGATSAHTTHGQNVTKCLAFRGTSRTVLFSGATFDSIDSPKQNESNCEIDMKIEMEKMRKAKVGRRFIR